MSVHWPIIRRLVRHPRRIVCRDDRRSYSGIEILVGAMHIADEVRAVSGSRTLGLLLPTSGLFPMAALAGWMAGRTIVPLNSLLQPEELQYVINDCETDTVVTVGPMLDFLAERPKGVRFLRLDEMSFAGVPDIHFPAIARSEDLAVLLYTSGTSGKPKGVMLSHGNIGANVGQVVKWARFTKDDRLLGVLPQFHSFGFTVLTVLPMCIGASAVYAARFVPQHIIRLLREHRPTAFVAIPSMYNALLRAKDAGPEDFASLRYIVSGGEPLPDAVARAFHERFGVRIAEGYGLTETAPVTNWCRPEEWKAHSVGRAVPRVNVRIVDPDSNQDLPTQQEGEVRLSGPNVMRGYFKLPTETASAFDERGFFRTGDIGRVDRDGHLYITGRLKEMIIVGGENVFPREIEEALDAHEKIHKSGVVGAPDPVRGEVPVAFVELAEGVDPSQFDEREAQSFCRARIAGYKVPREIRVVEALPTGPTGKVLRRELSRIVKEEAAAQAGE